MIHGSYVLKDYPPAQEPDGHGAENYSSTVQISTDCNIVTDAWYCFSNHTWYKSGFGIIGRVVAWEPLPESYKG